MSLPPPPVHASIAIAHRVRHPTFQLFALDFHRLLATSCIIRLFLFHVPNMSDVSSINLSVDTHLRKLEYILVPGTVGCGIALLPKRTKTMTHPKHEAGVLPGWFTFRGNTLQWSANDNCRTGYELVDSPSPMLQPR